MIYIIIFSGIGLLIFFYISFYRDKRINDPKIIRQELYDFVYHLKSYKIAGPLNISGDVLESFHIMSADDLFFPFTPNTEWYRENNYNDYYKPPSPSDLFDVYYQDKANIHHLLLSDMHNSGEEYILFLLSIYIGKENSKQKNIAQDDIDKYVCPFIKHQNWKIRKLSLMTIYLYHDSNKVKERIIKDCLNDKSKRVVDLAKFLQIYFNVSTEAIAKDKDRTYNCIICGKETLNHDNYEKHLDRHLEEKPVKPAHFISEDEKNNYNKDYNNWLKNNKEILKKS